MAHVRQYGPRSVASGAVLTDLGRIDGQGLARGVSYFYFPALYSFLCVYCVFYGVYSAYIVDHWICG